MGNLGPDVQEQLQRSHNLEALKLIVDWSKWLVATETGAIAAIGALLGQYLGKEPAKYLTTKLTICLDSIANIAAITAVACFVVSIIWATLLMLSVPMIAQRLPTLSPYDSIWEEADGIINQRLTRCSYFQYRYFLAGIISFALFVAFKVIVNLLVVSKL